MKIQNVKILKMHANAYTKIQRVKDYMLFTNPEWEKEPATLPAGAQPGRSGTNTKHTQLVAYTYRVINNKIYANKRVYH